MHAAITVFAGAQTKLAILDGLRPLYFGEPEPMPPATQPDAAAPPEKSDPARSIAYLSSRYPTLSMTFVLREVLVLRALGFRIETASINPPDRLPEKLTWQEREEAAKTYCVKRHGLSGAAAAHAKALLGNFPGYWRGFALAFRLGGLDLRRLFLNLAYFTEALMVGQWMRHNGQIHLHVHLASQAASVGLFTQRVFGVGYSFTVHGPDEFYDVGGQYLTQKIAAADFIVCISSYTRSQLMNLSPYAHWGKMVVARLGVDAMEYSPLPNPSLQDAFEILCVGRLTPAKGQHLLIDAVASLTQQGRRVRLRLVGNGPDYDSLRAHADRLANRETIVFEGAVNQDRIRSLYATADVFCLPSFAEGLPVVLMEAMSMQIPCVTSSIAGIPELIRDGIDGLLVPASDVDALVDSLAMLMDDEKLRNQLAKNGRTRILEHYDLAPNVKELAAIFVERIKA
jgi:glycosyltransferase involved in cell wall biosynthesis